MIHVRVASEGVCRMDAGVEALPALLQDERALVWVDLEAAGAEEIAQIGRIFGWNPLLVEDLVHQGQRAKLESFGEYFFLVMHALSYEGAPAQLGGFEVDFVVGPRYVVSAHAQPIPHIATHRDEPERAERTLGDDRDHLLWVLCDQIVDSYGPVLDEMDDAVDQLEDEIVTHPTQDLMGRIFAMKRDGVLARKLVTPQLEVFARLSTPGYGLIAEAHAWPFRDVHDHLIRIGERLDSYRELMAGALDAYLSTVSNRMNEVMKRLTVLAALFLPITFITGLFGMNLRRQPLWEDFIFWVVLAAMLAISVGQYVYMRRKGWA